MVQKNKILANIKEIRNSSKRKALYAKLRIEKAKKKNEQRKQRRREAVQLGIDEPKKKAPPTKESNQPPNETTVELNDEQIQNEHDIDEFSSYYNNNQRPKICITTCQDFSKRCNDFAFELQHVFPNSFFYPRKGFIIKDIVEQAIEAEYTDILIINENRKQINGQTLIHLPDGPTAYFRQSNVKLNKEINNVAPLKYVTKPEIILNHFKTRLGVRIGRMLSCLFQQDPVFKARHVVTFHNQRDYIFFRHHRYVFENLGINEKLENEERDKLRERALQKYGDKRELLLRQANNTEKNLPLRKEVTIINESRIRASIQEIGPQFTMKIMWLQHGTFDREHGDMEWIYDSSSRKALKFHQ